MTVKEEDKIISWAKNTKYYCNLLIEQSESWLSEEEGYSNMEKCLAKSTKNRWIKFFMGLFNLC